MSILRDWEKAEDKKLSTGELKSQPRRKLNSCSVTVATSAPSAQEWSVLTSVCWLQVVNA